MQQRLHQLSSKGMDSKAESVYWWVWLKSLEADEVNSFNFYVLTGEPF